MILRKVWFKLGYVVKVVSKILKTHTLGFHCFTEYCVSTSLNTNRNIYIYILFIITLNMQVNPKTKPYSIGSHDRLLANTGFTNRCLATITISIVNGHIHKVMLSNTLIDT